MTRTHPNQSLEHFNLPNHSILSLHLGSLESRKTLEQKFIFQIVALTPHGINEPFYSTYLFLFSRHHIPTDSIAQFSSSNRSD